MGYSKTVFDIVADLIVEDELAGQHALIRSFDDIVIALSLDSGLPMDEVQSRLVERMLMDKNGGFIISNVFSMWDADTKTQISTRA